MKPSLGKTAKLFGVTKDPHKQQEKEGKNKSMFLPAIPAGDLAEIKHTQR